MASRLPFAARFQNESSVAYAPQTNHEWRPDLDDEDLLELQAAQHDDSKIVTSLPQESNRLGYYSAVCLIFNRMIGTGIFNSGSIVFSNTKSIGISLVFWALGAILALAGVIVYVELGLSVPRWSFGANGEKISTPRSGEALNYFNYYLKRPLFLATCLFGIPFIILENTAANSVAFAQQVLAASHKAESPGKIIGIALAINTCACLLHAVSRKWGIILNNALGTFKILLLVFIVIIGLAFIDKDVARDNFDTKTSFSTASSPNLPYRWAEAFIYIIFPYSTFHQINYVISELKEPRKTFPRASWWGVFTIAILYTLVQTLFAAIIPKAQLFKNGGVDVGGIFFERTLGKVWKDPAGVQTFFSALKAVSAFGNIIVVTFTAARVKQEIAKEGVLPYSLYFAASYDLSIERLFRRKSYRQKAEVTSMYSERTPAAALGIHWIFTTIMVIVPVLVIKKTPYSATPAQTFLVGVFVYVVDLCCFVALSIGMLCLRFTPSVRWAEKSHIKNPVVSITAALILLILSSFPLICIWIPDPTAKYLSRSSDLIAWYTTQTSGIALLALAFMYWIAFRLYIRIRTSREGTMLHIRREPKFKPDSHGLTQILEIVTLQWKRVVDLRLDEVDEVDEVDFKNQSTTFHATQFTASDPRISVFSEQDKVSPISGRNTPEGLGSFQSPIRRKPMPELAS